jgi:hypothetical protein
MVGYKGTLDRCHRCLGPLWIMARLVAEKACQLIETGDRPIKKLNGAVSKVGSLFFVFSFLRVFIHK